MITLRSFCIRLSKRLAGRPGYLLSSDERGTSLFELIVVGSIMLIVASTALPNLRELNSPLQNASQSLLGYFKQVRARAVSSTRAYVITPASATRVTAGFANTCAEAAEDGVTPEKGLTLDLPLGTTLSDTDWSICYNSRGAADTNASWLVLGEPGQQKAFEIFLGGAVRVL